MNQHAHHTARRITAAAIGLALSCVGLGSQAVAYATQPAATDVTVIAFQQNWKTVAEECANTYGPEGVKYVQISPPQESVQGTQWWTVYQPVSYKLNSRFGTEDELKSMIKQCKAAGVDVIADVVLNHTTGHDVSWVDDQYGVDSTAYNGSYGRYPSMDPYAEGGTQGLYQYQESGNNHQYGLPSGDFHTCKSNVSDNISDYSNADEVWNCRLSTMWDINTGNGRVQNMQADYLNRLWQDGVRGFRIDSAKHMDPDDIAAIKRKFMDKAGINGQSFPWSQEVIYHQGESSKFAPERYEKNGEVTQFSYAYSLLKDFNGSITDLKYITSDLLKRSDDATVFVANWDSARGSETLSPTSGARYELANAFMLGYDYGHPKILSDYYFDKSTQYDDGVKDTSDTKVPYVDMNEACATSKDPTQMTYGDWNCQQRWTSIRGMIRFHNAVNGTKVTNWQERGDNNIAFDRAADGSSPAKGFMAINNTLQDHDVDYTTTLPDGEYCDVYASRDCSKTVTVSDGHVKTTIGKRSAIALYQGAVAESDPGKGQYEPQYSDSPNSTLIGDKTLTVYYKPKQDNAAVPELHYQKTDGTEQHISMKAVEVADSTDARGWYSADLPEGANLAAAKFYFTDGTDTDRPDGNGWYQSQVGDTMVNVCDGTVGRGVPYARTYTGQHAGQTKVTVNFKPTDSVGERATGVRVWTDDQMKSTYLPFDATGNGFGKIAQGYVDGTQSQVRFRIVDGETADEASAGTKDSYLASTWKLDKFANAYVDGAIEAWVDGNQPQTVSDRSPEKASPAATPQPNDIKNPKTLTVKLHYYRADGRYQDYDMESDTWKGWDLWSWYKESTSGVATPFNGHDDFGEVAEYKLSQTGKGVRDPWFIIRNGGSSWTGKDCDDNDRQIPESVINVQAGDLAAGTAEFWILSGDPTIYAHPVAATGVTFDTQGGSSVGAQTVKVGGMASEPAAPTKDGYKFVRWTTDAAGTKSYTFGTPVNAPVTLYAQWAEAHKVTFDTTGGSAVETQLVGDGEAALIPAAPTREGYTFAGWSASKSDGNAYVFSTPVTKDVTLYAQWTPNTYTVTFNSNGGTLVTSATVKYGQTVTKPTDPTLDGKVFVGWTTDAAGTRPYGFGTPVTGDLTLYAKWADDGETYHTVTLNLKEGTDYPSTALQSMTLFVKGGEKLAIPDPAPTRDGYRLAGWTTDEARQTDYMADALVTHDLTLYAKWVKTWTVTFDTQDGTPVTTQIVDDNSHATVPNPAPARDEYKLTGWSTDATGGTDYDFNATPVTGDVTLYAEWTRTSHQWTIKFDLNGGAAPEGKEATKLYADQKVYDGDPLISPTVDQTNVPVLEGYEFQGWSTVRNDALAKSVLSFDENGKSLMPIDRDGTVYALWAKMGTVVKPPTSTSDSTTQSQIGAYSNTETGLNGLAMFEAVVRQPGKFPNTDFGSITEESTPWVN